MDCISDSTMDVRSALTSLCVTMSLNTSGAPQLIGQLQTPQYMVGWGLWDDCCGVYGWPVIPAELGYHDVDPLLAHINTNTRGSTNLGSVCDCIKGFPDHSVKMLK